MKRWLAMAVAALASTVHADKKTAPPAPQRIDCYVYNNTDHELALGNGLAVGESRPSLGTQTIKDGAQTLEVTCSIPDEGVRLVGTTGAVTIERLPAWFRAYGDDGRVRVTATKKGAKVTVEGIPVPLEKGEGAALVDARGKLLAGDPSVMFVPDRWRGEWRVPVEVKATAGKESATLIVGVELSRGIGRLTAELHNADKVPVDWVTSTDHRGPAIVFGCSPTSRFVEPNVVQPRDFELTRSPHSFTEVSLVATCELAQIKIDTCPLSTDPYFVKAGTPPVDRYRVDAKVTLVETKTGKVAAATTLKGGTPGPCRNVATTTIRGSVPGASEILGWMDTIK